MSAEQQICPAGYMTPTDARALLAFDEVAWRKAVLRGDLQLIASPHGGYLVKEQAVLSLLVSLTLRGQREE